MAHFGLVLGRGDHSNDGVGGHASLFWNHVPISLSHHPNTTTQNFPLKESLEENRKIQAPPRRAVSRIKRARTDSLPKSCALINYYCAMELVEGESLAALIRRSGCLGTDLAFDISETSGSRISGHRETASRPSGHQAEQHHGQPAGWEVRECQNYRPGFG